MFKYLLAIFSLLTFQLSAQTIQTIRIKVVDQSNKIGIENCNIVVLPYQLNAKTDINGWAELKNIPTGRLEIRLKAHNYATKIVDELELNAAKQLVLYIELEPNAKNLNEVIVTSASNNSSGALTSIHSITQEQIMRFPATFFDPARLAFSFAGVANTNDQANGMSIRGNAPETVQWRLEGAEIVNPNHLSNAGTFSDKPTQTGGGTNILSAQMLGNMNFLTGNFPAEYGNAMAGVMDMKFRVGNNQKNEYTAQVGLIGIDLAAEGPINKTKGSSFLVNYRYSFTGILGLMGIKFGGEKIAFQDLSFNLNFPTKRVGTFNIFSMGGISSNTFSPGSDSTKWTSDKYLQNIDFYSKMAVLGIKNNITLNKKWNVKTVITASGLENLRNAYTNGKIQYNVNYDYNAKSIISGSSILSGNIFSSFNLKTGVYINQYFNQFNYINSDTKFYKYEEFIAQPFIKISNANLARFNYNLGVQGMYYSYSNSVFAEPRLAVNYHLTNKIKLSASYGLYSHQTVNRYTHNQTYSPIRSHQSTIGAEYKLNPYSSFKIEGFYQAQFNVASSPNQYVSPLNSIDNADIYLNSPTKKNNGVNSGVELTYNQNLNNGFFALINATLYKSEFRAFDNQFYQSRYSGNHIFNLTIGKEWQRQNGAVLGINTRIVWLGGFRNYKIDLANSVIQQTTVYDYSQPLMVKNPDYFRPDLRIYLKKSKAKTANMLSLDIQNFANKQNLAYQYYDIYLKQIVNKYQLGLVPMINYRWEF